VKCCSKKILLSSALQISCNFIDVIIVCFIIYMLYVCIYMFVMNTVCIENASFNNDDEDDDITRQTEKTNKLKIFLESNWARLY